MMGALGVHFFMSDKKNVQLMAAGMLCVSSSVIMTAVVGISCETDPAVTKKMRYCSSGRRYHH